VAIVNYKFISQKGNWLTAKQQQPKKNKVFFGDVEIFMFFYEQDENLIFRLTIIRHPKRRKTLLHPIA